MGLTEFRVLPVCFLHALLREREFGKQRVAVGFEEGRTPRSVFAALYLPLLSVESRAFALRLDRDPQFNLIENRVRDPNLTLARTFPVSHPHQPISREQS